jgi:hypothetical protein
MTEQLSKIGSVLALFVVLVIASSLGYAWAASSAEIANTGPWQLHISYQGIYVQAVADAYALDSNDALAAERLSFICQQDNSLANALDEAGSRYGADQVKKDNLDKLRALVDSGQVTQNDGVMVCNTQPINQYARLARTVAPILLILVGILIVGYGIVQIVRAGEEEAAAPAKPEEAKAETVERRRPTLPSIGRKPKPPETAETAKSAAAAGARISATVEKTDFERVGEKPPIVQFMTTYLHGDDLYDDSFSIETSSGEFLGETGVGISETIGAGETKNVAGFEIWLFDKNDIRTVTKVLMSDHAFNDDAIRAKLAPKGEAVLAKPGDKLILETATLRVQARLVDFSYGSGPLPPDSFFERVTIELAAWKRGDVSGPAGAASPPRPMGGRAGTPPSGLPSPPGP